MKIAVIGSGVSGLTAAHTLSRFHDVDLWESAPRPGGHARTELIQHEGVQFPVDLGFVVFNKQTYPEFCKLLDQLGVASRPSEMSFSVQDPSRNLEYNGHGLVPFFAQTRNLVRPAFWKLTRDILRFNAQALSDARGSFKDQTLGDYLKAKRFGKYFEEAYILPMGGAIWSASLESMKAFPFHFFAEFFHNHGLLGVSTHHTWRTICGGSQSYVSALVEQSSFKLHCNTPIKQVRRTTTSVELKVNGEWTAYDQIVFAVHADTALKLLENPTTEEAQILSAFPYQSNEAVLHSDATMLPKRALARASWNFHAPSYSTQPVRVTYDMSRLQGLPTQSPILHTLGGADQVNPELVFCRNTFRHPQFTKAGIAAQQNHHLINGVDRIFYCGAYWRNGFHEDGVWSAIRAAKPILSERAA